MLEPEVDQGVDGHRHKQYINENPGQMGQNLDKLSHGGEARRPEILLECLVR